MPCPLAPGQAGALGGTPTDAWEQRAGGGTSAGRIPSKVTSTPGRPSGTFYSQLLNRCIEGTALDTTVKYSIANGKKVGEGSRHTKLDSWPDHSPASKSPRLRVSASSRGQWGRNRTYFTGLLLGLKIVC